MPTSFLARWRTQRAIQQYADDTAFLHDRVRFRTLLECERMRADRSRTRFSLAVFTFSPDAEGRERLGTFARLLEPRIRATDHPGFVDPCRIGVILWDTGEVGAWKFIDLITQSEGTPAPDRCEVFIYPSHEAPPPSSGTDANVPAAVVAASAASDFLESVSRDVAPPRPVQPLDLMFVKPLPVWKRVVDVVGASVGLFVLSPLMAATALAVKLTSRGPALFLQQRAGIGGRPFTIYKFRTMCIDAEEKKDALRSRSEQDGPAFKLKNDPRITAVGKYMRKSCLDELPQLWNVLKGDMTLVGPRPLPVDETDQIEGWKRRRLEVTPGLTCIWQIHGKSKVPFSEWMRMDIRYLRARSFWRDLKLMLHTLVAVVTHRASH